jgi:hypothetical protein
MGSGRRQICASLFPAFGKQFPGSGLVCGGRDKIEPHIVHGLDFDLILFFD